jgi:hypothetical protein
MLDHLLAGPGMLDAVTTESLCVLLPHLLHCPAHGVNHWPLGHSGVHHLTLLLLLLLLRLLMLAFLQAGQLSPDLGCEPQALQQHANSSCLPCSGVGGYLCGRLQGCPHSQLLLETCSDAP